VADHPQRVDVEAGVGLVEDRELRLEQRELQHLVALLLAAGEALVDAAVGEVGVDVEVAHRALDLLDPRAQLRRLAADGGGGRAQEVGMETPGTSTGHAWRVTRAGARRRSWTARPAVERDEPAVTSYFGWPAIA
jgi:hypothetical protein